MNPSEMEFGLQVDAAGAGCDWCTCAWEHFPQRGMRCVISLWVLASLCVCRRSVASKCGMRQSHMRRNLSTDLDLT